MEALLSFYRYTTRACIFNGNCNSSRASRIRKPKHQVLTGTLGPILGYLMLSAGANVIVTNLEPLSVMIETDLI